MDQRLPTTVPTSHLYLPPGTMVRKIQLSSIALGIAAALTSWHHVPGAEPQIDFNRDIRPILSDHCFACHGPDAAQRQGGLRLDEAEAAFAEADSGTPAIIAGDASASELIARIESESPGEMMPPEEVHKPLSAEQKQLLKDWINAGAEYAPHWSLIPPRRHPEPAVGDGSQIKDPIDSFIQAGIENAGLSASPPTDRRSLLRRLTYDLTGLPPTNEELADFLRDGSPEAYEKAVDRLLQSPRFGEHFGRYWLDLVRYGDTHGLHLDNYREMWPYRDWVIRAFNENKPYDQFIIEQLAGDLLPGEELEHQIASGFNRLNVTTSEGGSIYEEVFARNVIDRTDAFGTIFLGLTTGCAVCHDHKFDPLSQKDYYSLSAFFNSLDGQALDGNAKDHPPVIRVPTAEHLEQLAEVEKLQLSLEEEARQPIETVDAAQLRWEAIVVSGDNRQTEWTELVPTEVTSSGGSTLEVLEDRAIAASGTLPAKDTITVVAKLPAGKSYQLIRLEVLTDSAEERAGRSENGNAVLSEFEVATKTAAADFANVKLVYGQADHEQGDGAKFKIGYAIDGKVDSDAGWAIGGHEKAGGRSAWFVAGNLLGDEQQTEVETTVRVTLKFESQWAGHSFKKFRLSVSDALPSVSPERQLVMGPWHSIGPFETENAEAGYFQSFASQGGAFRADESFKYREKEFSWKQRDDFDDVAVNSLDVVDDRTSVVLLHRRITAPSAEKVTLLLGSEDGYQVWLNGQKVAEVKRNRAIVPLADEISLDLKEGENDLYVKQVHHDGPAAFAAAFRSPAAPLPESIKAIVAVSPDSRNEAQQQVLRDYYRRVVSMHPDWLVLRDMSAGLRKRSEDIRSSMPTTLVWREVASPRPAHILLRGEYDKPGEQVARDVPSSLPPMAAELPRDRLGLAQWLVSENHPLTARVVVNRFWQQLFGVGIVRTSEDFGAQGRPPSHPELLDTLAVDFQADGWNVKQLIKRLVMTGTYQRSNSATAEQLAADPNNRWLARGPRFRLDAEMIRDSALFTSGLLVEKLGGPSVKPPQPDGLWRAVGYTSSNTAVFKADSGDKVYRRSVYTFWKRTSAPPQMSTFDAPSRESCTARRERTNTPLQALLLMNEPQYLEAAQNLAKLAQQHVPSAIDDQIRWMFERVTSLEATEVQVQSLGQLYADLCEIYQSDSDLLAKTTLPTAEVAAMSMVASTILNTDAALNK